MARDWRNKTRKCVINKIEGTGRTQTAKKGATMRTTKGKLTSINSYLSKASLIINDFNYPVKGHKLAE